MWGMQDLRSRPDLLRTFTGNLGTLRKLTLWNLDTLYRFIPYGSSALLDELVTLKADVQNFSTLNA